MSTTFAYKVRDRTGALLEGNLEADDERLVLDKLREMGYVPVSISARRSSKLGVDLSIGKGKVALKDVAIFSRQLATMINSGLTILRALAILAEQTSSKALAATIGDHAGGHRAGLSRCPRRWPGTPRCSRSVYLSMIRAGETGGSLDEVLLRLATTLEKQLELRGKVRSALAYPIAVGCLVVLIVSGMLIFVVPMFKGMYQNLGGTLPLPTRVLVGISGMITKVWWLLAILGVGGYFGFRHWSATPTGELVIDRFKLKAPVFGPLVHKSAIARFTRTFASLMRTGVPIMEALDIVAGTSGNAVVRTAVDSAKGKVRVGEPVSTALANSPVFPPMVTQMMSVGEETGRPRRDAREDLRLLRPRGVGHRRRPDLAARAAADGVHGRIGGRHDHRPLHADVQHHQAGQLTT